MPLRMWRDGNSLSKLWRLQERRLVKSETGRQNERGVLLPQEEVDNIQEPGNSILVLRADRHERRRDVCRHPNGVLNIKAL